MSEQQEAATTAGPAPTVSAWADASTADAQSNERYHQRAGAVYHQHQPPTPACRARGGPHHAVCMLVPDHQGDHYGSGYDEGGPKPGLRWEAR